MDLRHYPITTYKKHTSHRYKATPHHIRKSGNLGIECPTKINKKTALPQKTNKQVGERLKETPLPSQNYSDPTLYSNSTIIH